MTFNELKFEDFFYMSKKYIKKLHLNHDELKKIAKEVQHEYNIESFSEGLACAYLACGFKRNDETISGLFKSIEAKKNELEKLKEQP